MGEAIRRGVWLGYGWAQVVAGFFGMLLFGIEMSSVLWFSLSLLWFLSGAGLVGEELRRRHRVIGPGARVQ